MKELTLICALLLALALPGLAPGQTKSKAPQAGGAEQQLKQIEDKWAKAIKNKDAATLKGILAEAYSATDEKGKTLSREQYLAQTAANQDTIASDENSDVQVRVYGNAAVVTGSLTEKGTRSGADYTDTYRWTDVYVKLAGRWQAVASQWAKVP